MKALALLFCVPVLLFNCEQTTRPAKAKEKSTQSKQQASAAYIHKAVDFIKQLKQVKGREHAAVKFILSDIAISLNSNNCLQQVLEDKTFYSSSELKLIEGHGASAEYHWKETDFPNVKLISQDTVRAIFKNRGDNWGYFYKHIGPGFNEFSLPVFIRNDTYCLFYSADYCGGLCAEGSLNLYKKEGGRWKLVKSYCTWIS